MKKVCIALSGGVDSAVSALLLKEQGYDVFALFMRNWEEVDGSCNADEDYEDIVRICHAIDIPYFSVNFTKEYWDEVFTDFLREMQAGRTPNPDILCNREIKFKWLYNKALSLGADYLATGHYCQTKDGTLLRGADANKDQSYFLYTLKKEILQKVLFPIGHLQKSEVRRIAKEHNLPVHDKKDSTGICFIGERKFRTFVQQYIPINEGNFIDLDGRLLGTHQGAAFYTIGQRKGLGIGGPGEAWFVVDKDIEANTVTIVQGTDHPALYAHELIVDSITWIDTPAPSACTAKIRYRQMDDDCIIGDDNRIMFAKPQRAITPGQSIVFYNGNVCLGGGIIDQKGTST